MRRLVADVWELSPGSDEESRPIGPALVSALEAVLEQDDVATLVSAADARHFLQVWSKHLGGALLASASCVAARVVYRTEGITAAWAMFAAAEQKAAEWRENTVQWADWVAPDSLVDRVRLEWVLCRPKGEGWTRFGAPPEVWLSEASARASTIDGERLASYLLAELQEERIPERTSIELLEATDLYSVERRARCVAHERVSPLFVSVARAWLALGEVERALRTLDEREAEALRQRSATPDSATARAAQQEVIAIVRLMRLSERIPQVERYIEDEELGPAAWVAYTLAGPYVPGQARAAPASRLHAWYRALPTAGEAAAARDVLVGTDPAIRLDAYEARLAAERNSVDPEPGPDDLRLAHDVIQASRGPAGKSAIDPWYDGGAEHSRAMLRAWALGLPVIPPSAGSYRHAAAVALEEGELLALRLPEKGSQLLAYALDRYQRADDPVGVVIAGTALALARLRMERPVDAEKALAYVRTGYERLEVAVPTWEGLADDRAVDLGGVDRGWIDWVLRLRACLHAVAARHLTLQGPRPIELHLPQLESRRTLWAEESLRGLWSRPRVRIAGALVSALVLAAVLLQRPVRGWLTKWIVATLPAGPYLFEVAYWAFVAWLAIYLTRKGTLLFVRVVDLGDGRAHVSVAPHLRAAPSTRLTRNVGGVPMLGAFVYYWAIKLLVWRPAITVYVSLGEVESGEMPSKLRRRLRRWFPKLFGGRTPTVLAVDPTLASVPWEAWLTSGSGSRARANPFRVRRGGPAPSWAHWRRRSVAITGSPSWRLLFEERLGATGPVVPWPSSAPGVARRVRRTVGERPVTIAQAIGVPVLTTLGWRLRVDETTGELTRSKIAPRSQVLLSPDDLVEPGAALVVIMAAPAGTIVELDRDISDGLRQLANEVVAAGTYAALTVPELPPDLAVEAVSFLVRRLRRPIGSKNAKRLVATVARVREKVAARSTETTGGDAATTAMDICLVVSDKQPAKSPFLDLPVGMTPIPESPRPAFAPSTESR